MANESTLIDKIATLAEESSFPKTLPPTNGTKLLELRDAGIVIAEGATEVKPASIRASASFQRQFTGTFAPSAELPCYGLSQGLVPMLMKALLGQATSAQQIAPDTGTYKHEIRVLEDIPYGKSKGLSLQAKLSSGKVFDMVDSVVDRMVADYAPNQELHLNFFLEGRLTQASAATLASLTAPVQAPLKFSQLTFTVGGVSREISALNFEINNNYAKDIFANSDKRLKFLRGGHREVVGSFTFPFVDSVVYGLYDNWREGTGAELVAKFEGVLVQTNFKYTIQFKFPNVRYAFENIPGGGGADLPDGPVPFVALETSNQKEIEIDVINDEASV